jgi:hypothetical protein
MSKSTSITAELGVLKDTLLAFNEYNESDNNYEHSGCDNPPRQVHHHYGNNYYGNNRDIFWMNPWYGSPRQTVIIHNHKSSDKKKEDEENEKNNKLYADMLLVGGAFLYTYIFASDPYVKLYLSGLSKQIMKMKMLQQDEIVNKTKKWNKSYVKRTKSVFYSKIVSALSTMVSIYGLYGSNNVCVRAGTIGGVGSLCFMLWKYLTKNTVKEKQLYNEALQEIDDAENKLYPSAPSDPSAPPKYSQY